VSGALHSGGDGLVLTYSCDLRKSVVTIKTTTSMEAMEAKAMK
jgi:hypothetical protein